MGNQTGQIANVKSALPGPRSRALFERWERAEAQCTGYEAQVVWDHALGVVVTDVDGNTFLDWTSGVLVTSTGHCVQDQVKDIQDASAKLMHNYESLNDTRDE